jgi:hypothetical protein
MCFCLAPLPSYKSFLAPAHVLSPVFRCDLLSVPFGARILPFPLAEKLGLAATSVQPVFYGVRRFTPRRRLRRLRRSIY